jgi:hypothetical protein
MAMSVAMMEEKSTLRKPVQSGAVSERPVRFGDASKRKANPCLRRRVVMRRQCMFSSTDVSL